MKSSFARRFEALEKRSTGRPMISGAEVAAVKAALWSKLGIGRQSEHTTSPISSKAVEKAGTGAREKLRSFLDRHGECHVGLPQPPNN
jgi:hypothetical protein